MSDAQPMRYFARPSGSARSALSSSLARSLFTVTVTSREYLSLHVESSFAMCAHSAV